MATTTESGLGWRQQQERAAALGALDPGEPCPLCGYPMYHPEQRLDLDHSVPRALGGDGPRRLALARCNRRAGGRLGNQLRWRRAVSSSTSGVRTSRQW